MSTEAEREALRAEWRRLSGSAMPPIATHVAECPECGRTVGAKWDGKHWRVNLHGAGPFAFGFGFGLDCRGAKARLTEARPIDAALSSPIASGRPEADAVEVSDPGVPK